VLPKGVIAHSDVNVTKSNSLTIYNVFDVFSIDSHLQFQQMIIFCFFFKFCYIFLCHNRDQLTRIEIYCDTECEKKFKFHCVSVTRYH
jgi:hypothetical protein